MKRTNLLLLFIAIIFGVTNVYAGSLVVPNTFSSGETITHSSFNANFDAIETWAAGNIGSDNITDASVASIDIANGTIVAADVASNTLTTSELGTASVDTDELASNAVTTAKITNLNVTEAKIATDAVQVVYHLTEGTMTDGVCTTQITMDVTGTRPTDNTVLKQSINPDDTNFASETIIAALDIKVECLTNCGNGNPEVAVQCNWDATWEAWRSDVAGKQVMNSAGDDYNLTTLVHITPADGDAHDLFCVIWDEGTSTATYDYCAKMIIQHIKR